MGKVLLAFALVLSLVFGCGGDDGPSEDEELESGILERDYVQEAVDKIMIRPETNVYDLMTDSRLACSEGGCTICDDDPIIDECTNQKEELITISDSPGEGDNEVEPTNLYPYDDETMCYYCVHPDGTVEGFLADGTNIRDL